MEEKYGKKVEWTGQFPSPATLKEYNDINPGTADRILKMEEQNTAHRIQMEKQEMAHRIRMEEIKVRTDSLIASGRLAAGWVISLAGIFGSMYVIQMGYGWLESSALGICAVGLVGVFVRGTHSRRAEREQKAEVMRRVRD